MFDALLMAASGNRGRSGFLAWYRKHGWAHAFIHRVVHVNLMNEHEQAFPRVRGAIGAELLRLALQGESGAIEARPDYEGVLGWRPEYVMLVGRVVAHVCNTVFPEADGSSFLAWKRTVGPASFVATVPHPSRRSRVWNFETNRDRVLRFLEATARRL